MRRIEEQERRIAELEARLNEPPKNSDNSHKPPSKEFKSNKGEGKGERTGPRQGSLGRKGSHRPLAENPDEIVRVMARRCGKCCGELSEGNQTRVDAYDKIDIPEVKPRVTRVEIYEGVCPCCSCATAPMSAPDGMEKGSPFSLNIVALALYLRVVHAISYERLACLFRDLFGLAVSEGGLDAMLRRAKPRFDKEVTAGSISPFREAKASRSH